MTKELPEWFLKVSELSFFCPSPDHDCHCFLDPAGIWAKGQPSCPEPWRHGMKCSLPHRNSWNLKSRPVSFTFPRTDGFKDFSEDEGSARVSQLCIASAAANPGHDACVPKLQGRWPPSTEYRGDTDDIAVSLLTAQPIHSLLWQQEFFKLRLG